MLAILKVAAAAVALVNPLAQGAPESKLVTPVAQASIQLEVCNETADEAVVAVHYIPVGGSSWKNEGWYTIPARQCKNVVQTTNAYIYARAEVSGDPDSYWAGEETHCVIYPGPFDFWETSADYCEQGQETVGFQEIHFDGQMPGTFTWRLTD